MCRVHGSTQASSFATGAPFIALGLLSVAGQPEAPIQAATATPALPEVPTPPYDPYLGASIRWDGFQAREQTSPQTPSIAP